jgi:molybdenum cofactor biosynthesis protein A
MLIDNHQRIVNYLRLSVTDQCNLRCQYCMPEEGIRFSHPDTLLSWEEMLRLCQVLTAMGVDKIRITGGEPFVRKGLVPFLESLSVLPGLKEISITTNATLIGPHIPSLRQLPIGSVNVSLDSLDPQRFFAMTRRNVFPTVMENLLHLIKAGMEVKLNCVVMDGKNTGDILAFIDFAHQHDLTVRFLEEMPFNGSQVDFTGLNWNHQRILAHIQSHYPELEKLPAAPSSTSVNYRVKGMRGSFGIIPSFSRTFCGTCNRLRISAQGQLRTCLYSNDTTDLKQLLRSLAPKNSLRAAILMAMGSRFVDGFEAEKQAGTKYSMTLLGG